MSTTPETFGLYVKAARQQRGQSLRQLESRSGVTNPTIKRVEDGFITVPTPEVLLALVDALELDIIKAVQLIEPYRRLYERIIAAVEGHGDSDNPEAR